MTLLGYVSGFVNRHYRNWLPTVMMAVVFHGLLANAAMANAAPVGPSRTGREIPPESFPPAAESGKAETPKNTSGILICEPVPGSGVDSKVIDFAAGCGDYLFLNIGGLPSLWQTPQLYSVRRAQRELKKTANLQFGLDDGVHAAKITGAPNVAVGTVDATAGGLTLTYTIFSAASRQPLGEPFTISGTPEKILDELPAMAVNMAHALGLLHPLLSPSVSLTVPEISAIGRTFWRVDRSLSDIKVVEEAASKDSVANICLLSCDGGDLLEGRPILVESLLTKLAPKNSLAWGYAARRAVENVVSLQPQLSALATAYPRNYSLAEAKMYVFQAQGNYKKQEAAGEQTIRIAPQNPDAWLALGDCLMDRFQEIRQGKLFNDIEKGSVPALRTLYARWVICGTRATDIDPEHEYGWLELAKALTFASKPKMAERAFWKAEMYSRNKVDVCYWGFEMFDSKWHGSTKNLEKVADAAETADYDSIDDVIGVIDSLNRIGAEPRAKVLANRYAVILDAKLKANPNVVSLHWQKVNLLERAGLYEISRDEYKPLIALIPNDGTARRRYADALGEVEDYPAAVLSYRAALKIDASDSQAVLGLGTAFLHERNLAEAGTYLKQAVEMAPGSAPAHYDLGALYELTGHQSQAEAEFETCVSINGGPEGYGMLVHALESSGLLPQAIQWAQKGLDVLPDDPRMPVSHQESTAFHHALLGYAFLKNKQYTEAEREYSTALRLWPNNDAAQVTMGYVYDGLGRRGDARKQWEAALKRALSLGAADEAKHDLVIYPENGT